MRILPQPDLTTCGPTCLHAVYAHYGDELPLDQVIDQIAPLPTGGTLAVSLATHALSRGYDATIYTYNLHMFDPTWFTEPAVDLSERLAVQAARKTDPKLRLATDAYRHFLELGGRVVHRELRRGLIAELLERGAPVLTGLSATYLYGCAREQGNEYDDVGGEPAGHFVLLHDYDPQSETLDVADPLHDNPRFQTQHYRVSADRVISSILLGVVTYDANLLLIRPR